MTDYLPSASADGVPRGAAYQQLRLDRRGELTTFEGR